MQTKKKEKQSSPQKQLLILILCLVLVGALIFLISIPVCAALQVNRWIRVDKQPLDTFPFDLGLQYHTFQLAGPQGSLMGWVIPAQEREQEEEAVYSDRTVVFSHNYDSNRQMNDIDGMYYIRDLVERGYNVVTFDYSGCGYSDGEVNVFDLDKSEELLLVLDYARQETGAAFLALQGVGFGCTPALEAAAADASVDALILDSCYGDFKSWFTAHYADWSSYTYAPYRQAILWMLPRMADVDVWSASPMQTLSSISDRRILFIQGESDEVFGVEDARNMYEQALSANSAALWTPPGASHLRAYSEYAEDYIRRVNAFLTDAYEAKLPQDS